MGGQVHSAEPFGSADTIHRTVPAANFSGDVHGGAQGVASIEAVVFAECGGGAIYVIAGRVGHAGYSARAEEEACGSC